MSLNTDWSVQISSSTITGLPFLNIISDHLLPSSMKWVLAAERHRSFAECSHCLRLLDSKVIAISDRKRFQTINLEQPQGRKVLPESTFPSVYHWCVTASFPCTDEPDWLLLQSQLGLKDSVVVSYHIPYTYKNKKKSNLNKKSKQFIFSETKDQHCVQKNCLYLIVMGRKGQWNIFYYIHILYFNVES